MKNKIRNKIDDIKIKVYEIELKVGLKAMEKFIRWGKKLLGETDQYEEEIREADEALDAIATVREFISTM